MRNACFRANAIFISVLVIFNPLFTAKKLYAAQFQNRFVSIGSSVPLVNTNHLFQFDIMTVANVGSVLFEYCSDTALFDTPCTAPSGLNTSSTILSAQTGEVGFTVDPATTANAILISRPSSLASAVTASYNFTNIINPNTSDTVYVRVSTYASIDGTGARVDEGTVAFAIDPSVNVAGFVPPFLTFCVGITVAGNCSSASGEFISFGELSTNQPRFLTSQFAGATNDPGGYSTFVAGLTMTSGTNVIPALGAPLVSIPGVSQFGMNLRANTNPGVGIDPSGVGSSTPSPDFNQPNLYKFSNQIIASSPLPTEFNIFTVSYIVNISQNQSSGVYNTTLTYIATAAF